MKQFPKKQVSLKKLSLKKETITRLDPDKMDSAKGGGGTTHYISCLAVWCDEVM